MVIISMMEPQILARTTRFALFFLFHCSIRSSLLSAFPQVMLRATNLAHSALNHIPGLLFTKPVATWANTTACCPQLCRFFGRPAFVAESMQ